MSCRLKQKQGPSNEPKKADLKVKSDSFSTKRTKEDTKYSKINNEGTPHLKISDKLIHNKPVGAKTSFAIFHDSAPIAKTKTRTMENQKSTFSSNHDPVSYAEYNTSEDDYARELEGSNEVIKVRRQISDY